MHKRMLPPEGEDYSDPERFPRGRQNDHDQGFREKDQGHAMDREELPGTTAPRLQVGANRAVKKGQGNELIIKYVGGEPLKDLIPYANKADPPVFEVRIPAAEMTSANRQVRARQLWGNDVYTWDSDPVAVLMHLGFWSYSQQHPPSSLIEVRALLQLLPSQDSYPSCSRNSIRSRAWGPVQKGCSYKVIKVFAVGRGNQFAELKASPEGAAIVAPTWTPAQFERNLNTRAAASSLERRQRTMQEITVQYNLCNEPWVKYSLSSIADRGLKPNQWTSARFHKEVLFLESHTERFEISRVEPTLDSEPPTEKGETYRFAKCNPPLPLSEMWRVGLPLPAQYLDVIHPEIYWEDFQWSTTGVTVKSLNVAVTRLHWTDRRSPAVVTSPSEVAAA